MLDDAKILTVLGQTDTVAEAARRLGCSRAALYKRLANDEVRQQVITARRAAAVAAADELEAHRATAIKTLVDVMQDTEAAAGARIMAATAILKAITAAHERADAALNSIAYDAETSPYRPHTSPMDDLKAAMDEWDELNKS